MTENIVCLWQAKVLFGVFVTKPTLPELTGKTKIIVENKAQSFFDAVAEKVNSFFGFQLNLAA